MRINKFLSTKNIDFIAMKDTAKFLFNQIIHSILFIIFGVISLISNPLTTTLLKFIGHPFLSYSLITILVPLLCISILLIFLSFKFFNEVKSNYVDSILINNSISRKQLLVTKFLLILFILFVIIFFWFVYDLIFFLSLKMNNYAIVYSISMLINIFISFLFLTIFSIISIKFRQITSITLSSLLCFLFFVPSLITRDIIKNNNISVSYSNNEISFSKIVDKTGNYYIANIIDSNLYHINPINYINNPNVINYLIPSEWTLSLYNNLFSKNINVNDSGTNSKYSLVNAKFQEINSIEKASINNSSPILRGEDINPFSLDNYSYVKMILNNIEVIFKNSNTIDIKDNLEVQNLISNIKSNLSWNDSTMSDKQLKTIRMLTGIDTRFNQMFYMIKYSYELNDKIHLFLDSLKSKYSDEFYNLMEFLITSEVTQYNIFSSSNIMGTGLSINDLYPDIRVIDSSKPIIKKDYEFISNDLIRYVDNTPYYLNKFGKYETTNEFKNFMTSININNYEEWKIYFQKISLQYEEVNNFIINLFSKASNIIDFKLSNNYVSLDNYSYVLKLIPSEFIWFSNIVIVLYVISSIPLIYLLFYFNKNNRYYVI